MAKQEPTDRNLKFPTNLLSQKPIFHNLKPQKSHDTQTKSCL